MKIREDGAESIFQIMRAGVVSFLGVRAYLSLFNYPKIGGGIWHISHAFSGGMVMLLGMMILVIYSGEKVKKVALNVFGLGLGWFIDESGKYLTADNDYFFRPTVMIVYIFFVGLFLIYKLLNRNKSKVKKASKREIIIRKWVTKKQVMWGLLAYSIYFSVEKVREVGGIVWSGLNFEALLNYHQNYLLSGRTDIYMVVFKILFDTIASGLFLLGAGYFVLKKRLLGLRLFQYGLYVTIFLVTIVRFYFEQLGGMFELLLAIVFLEILQQYRKEIVR